MHCKSLAFGYPESASLAYYALWPSGFGNYFICKRFSSNPPVVTGICDPNNSWAWHHHHRINMCFVIGCFEISVFCWLCSKYWNFQGFLSAWGDYLSFSVPWRQKKLLGCGLLRGRISTQADTMLYLSISVNHLLPFYFDIYVWQENEFESRFYRGVCVLGRWM